jgi:nucleoside-diphosphate-sugar epimerase
MRVLIVGGSGWLGQATAALLATEGWEVVALSRSGASAVGEGVRGDVRATRIGLTRDEAAEVAASVTHILCCFGSVDWALGPRGAMEIHHQGTRNVLAFAAGCPRLERLVHVSSVLALGRASGRVGNRELALGQGFRNWYEYAKHVSEAEVRAAHDLPRRIVRLGDVMGTSPHATPSARHGLLAPLSYLLRGYPAHLADGGAFPVYTGDIRVAAAVLARALVDDAGGLTWTWFDPALPTLAAVLTALCSPWDVVPRIVDLPALQRIERWVAPRLGLPPAILEYARPWVDIDPRVIDQLPADLPDHRPGYVEMTAAALKARGDAPVGQFGWT